MEQIEFEKALDAIEDNAKATQKDFEDPDKTLLYAATIKAIIQKLDISEATVPQYHNLSSIRQYAAAMEKYRWSCDTVYAIAGDICNQIKHIRKLMEGRELCERS